MIVGTATTSDCQTANTNSQPYVPKLLPYSEDHVGGIEHSHRIPWQDQACPRVERAACTSGPWNLHWVCKIHCIGTSSHSLTSFSHSWLTNALYNRMTITNKPEAEKLIGEYNHV